MISVSHAFRSFKSRPILIRGKNRLESYNSKKKREEREKGGEMERRDREKRSTKLKITIGRKEQRKEKKRKKEIWRRIKWRRGMKTKLLGKQKRKGFFQKPHLKFLTITHKYPLISKITLHSP